MSIILGGSNCEVCKKDYWHSFGHPKWAGDQDNEIYQGYLVVSRSKKCLPCYIDGCWEEEAKNNAFLAWVFALLISERKR
jgi:hypothetical protein